MAYEPSDPNDFKVKLLDTKPDITKGSNKCISIFSGILGLDLGLHGAGFATKMAIDNDESAKYTSLINFPNLNYLCKDIRDINALELLNSLDMEKGEVDLLSGGPPCQPFSKSGLRKGLIEEKGMLFQHYIRLLSEIKPKSFLLENVRGIVSSNKGEDWKEIIEDFKKTGYVLYWKILDAANYGVPQFRQRLFIIGFSKRLKFTFPKITHGEGPHLKPYTTVNDVIGHIEDPGYYPEYNGKWSHLLGDIPEGLNYSYYCKERGHPNPIFKWRSKFWYFLLKIDRTRPSLTIQANPGNNTGPFHWENRKLGINEIKRLQTFPDWYGFVNPRAYWKNHLHIGNAVPPLLAYLIGLEISKALDLNKILTKAEYNGIILDRKKLSVKSGRGSGKGKLVIDSKNNKIMFNKDRKKYMQKSLVG